MKNKILLFIPKPLWFAENIFIIRQLMDRYLHTLNSFTFRKPIKIVFILFLFYANLILSQNLPEGFVYLDEKLPNIIVEMRYYSTNNFLGDTVDAYYSNRAIISEPAAEALVKVDKELRGKGYTLKVFDAYRPQSAVNHFVRWAKDLDDTLMKSEYYPNEDKKYLFQRGYIASKSGHSRGSTIDLTLCYFDGNSAGDEVDMGTPFDFFSDKSWPLSDKVTSKQKENRMVLRNAMINNGFKPYNKEWWHFTLKNEPYPKTYFDFPVK